jgi:1-acyl-sn-glycerol-3-phosphate acyltransferase
VSALRCARRALLLAAWTALTALALACAAALHPLSPGAAERAAAAALRLWARGTARIIGLRIERHGTAPRGPFVLVANHLSYLDVVVLAASLDASFVAKSDVAGWPVIGCLCRAVGTIFVDRTRKRDLLRVLPLLEQRLRAGGSIVLFPEGTTSDGSRVLTFRSPLFEAAVRARLPAHVATLTYTTPSGAPHPSLAICWWGDMDFLPHLRALLRLPRCTARVELVAAPIHAPDRKHLARSARAAIAQRLVPVTRGESPCPTVPCPPTPTSAYFARAPSC